MTVQMIPIAVRDDRHFIAKSDEDTILLNWQRLAVRFQVEEFMAIARALQSYDPSSRTSLMNPLITLVWVDQRMVQCWLVRIGLNLCPYALSILMVMIEHAYQVLQHGAAVHTLVPYTTGPTEALN
jgi:hypothetical protein